MNRTTDDSRRLALIDQHNELLNHYVGRQWLMGALVTYALLDAYIDAHFRTFKAEFETDPALPGGPPRERRMSLSFRWSF